mmetsp:Transcript_4563/g.8376  ORF Transcript_4563/g.8376 Transcript_4563/m.8376 type:complete len:244 (-) Transcript_4563:436-1167(-)
MAMGVNTLTNELARISWCPAGDARHMTCKLPNRSKVRSNSMTSENLHCSSIVGKNMALFSMMTKRSSRCMIYKIHLLSEYCTRSSISDNCSTSTLAVPSVSTSSLRSISRSSALPPLRVIGSLFNGDTEDDVGDEHGDVVASATPCGSLSLLSVLESNSSIPKHLLMSLSTSSALSDTNKGFLPLDKSAEMCSSSTERSNPSSCEAERRMGLLCTWIGCDRRTWCCCCCCASMVLAVRILGSW